MGALGHPDNLEVHTKTPLFQVSAALLFSPLLLADAL